MSLIVNHTRPTSQVKRGTLGKPLDSTYLTPLKYVLLRPLPRFSPLQALRSHPPSPYRIKTDGATPTNAKVSC